MPNQELPKGFIPFNPDIHVPQDLGLGEKGSLSTEYTTTMSAPNGGIWNIPTVWFDKDGKGQHFDEQTSARMAYQFEKERLEVGQFPRFKNIDDAVTTAKARSQAGGATITPLFELFGNLK